MPFTLNVVNVPRILGGQPLLFQFAAGSTASVRINTGSTPRLAEARLGGAFFALFAKSAGFDFVRLLVCSKYSTMVCPLPLALLVPSIPVLPYLGTPIS